MMERRKHKRFPIIKNMSEPIEVWLSAGQGREARCVSGILTNLSAGGIDMVLMDAIDDTPQLKMNMHLPGIGRCELEGKTSWLKPKGPTTALGIQFTKINQDHSHHINHMAEAYWECEDRVANKAPQICFHGCTYWDLCEKPVKLKK